MKVTAHIVDDQPVWDVLAKNTVEFNIEDVVPMVWEPQPDGDADIHVPKYQRGQAMFRFNYMIRPAIQAWLDEVGLKHELIKDPSLPCIRLFREQDAMLMKLTWG